MNPQPFPPEPGIETFFLLDEPGAVQVQQVLASLDMLGCFNTSAGPLQLTVVHRRAPTAQMLELFDSTPGLQCRHLDFAATGGNDDLNAGLAYLWRHFAALALAKSTRAPFYLVLDATCICMRQFDEQSLLEGGRAVSQWEPANLHPYSSAAAQALVGQDHMPGQILSTFPLVFARELAIKALDRIKAVGGKEAGECLLTAMSEGRLWSANAIYSCAAGAVLNDFHRPTELDGITRSLRGDVNVWDDTTDLCSWQPAEWLQLATHGQFLIAQGSDKQRLRQVLSRCYSLVDG